MESLLAQNGVRIAGSWHCPHHPDFTGPCGCRKPGLLLFQQAAETLGIDPRRSAFVGDRPSDVQPGLALGGLAFLVRTGYGQEQAAQAPAGVVVVADLAEVADRLLTGFGAVDTDSEPE